MTALVEPLPAIPLLEKLGIRLEVARAGARNGPLLYCNFKRDEEWSAILIRRSHSVSDLRWSLLEPLDGTWKKRRSGVTDAVTGWPSEALESWLTAVAGDPLAAALVAAELRDSLVKATEGMADEG